jgi:multimeric flavodoxin WrbA
MKILAVIGSPKGKGDGYKIVQQIEEQMKKFGDATFEYLLLKDSNLELCRGCFLCVSRGVDLCPLKDDRIKIEEEIINADGVILSSPGYVYNVSWLMKNFIDRFAYTNHRPRFFDQKVMLIANSGGARMEETIEAMRNTFGVGPEIVDELAYVTPPWPLTGKAEAKQRKAVSKAAKRLYDSIVEGKREVPGINKYLRFKFFKNVSSLVKDYLPADYEYYEDKDEYYYDTKISIFKKIAAWFALKIGMFFMRDLSPKDSK